MVIKTYDVIVIGAGINGLVTASILGKKGKGCKAINHSISNIVESAWTKHSEKPKFIRDKIVELFGDIPRIELFAREKAYGWDSWGNQV